MKARKRLHDFYLNTRDPYSWSLDSNEAKFLELVDEVIAEERDACAKLMAERAEMFRDLANGGPLRVAMPSEARQTHLEHRDLMRWAHDSIRARGEGGGGG